MRVAVGTLTTFTRRRPRPSHVFDTFWRFAAERQRVFHARATGHSPPWTVDPIISTHRFTNVYRAADRVSQFLINEVIPRSTSEPIDVVFRTLLFKIFNRISTWRRLEMELGELHAGGFDAVTHSDVLTRARAAGHQIYSAAYIMPMPNMPGVQSKHEAHLLLLARLLSDGALDRVCVAPTLRRTYELLLEVPSFGSFLAFQFAI